MANPTLRSVSLGTTLGTSLPAGNALDDFLIAIVSTETDGTTPTAATGWTLKDGYTTCAQVGRPLSGHLYGIARGASAPATNWSTGGAATPQVSYECWIGVDLADPWPDFIKNTTAVGADTVWECLAFTCTNDESTQVAVGVVNQWTTSTSTMSTEDGDGGATIAAHMYSNGSVNAGAIAQQTITSGEGWHVFHFALKPATVAVVDYITQEDTFKIQLEHIDGALIGENGSGTKLPPANKIDSAARMRAANW